MELSCQSDPRRDAVRRYPSRNGLDYVELGDDPLTLYVYFLGKLPAQLRKNRPGLERYLRLEGGEVIRGIVILDVDPVVESDPERDDYLVVRLDRSGDFSLYTLTLVDVDGIDPHYASTSFSFKIDCASDLDCKPEQVCPSPDLEEPRLSYLAKDFASFRQLLLDRLALLVPQWTERHVPDLGITLVELLAYVGDQLSYYQDAVATEAYLGTARQRISVRRHLRLIDYRLHEGCNARAWLHFTVSQDVSLEARRLAFISGANAALPMKQSILDSTQLQDIPAGSYEYYEPLVADAAQPMEFRAAHNAIRFYTWGRRECCLPAGASKATLLDQWVPSPAADCEPPPEPGRALRLRAGEVLIFEEVRGAKTGVDADADPQRRWAVRLTKVQASEDPLYSIAVGEGERRKWPTPVVEIEWASADALPFPLCISTLGRAPQCAYLTDVSVARGNVILVDHGRRLPPETLPHVPGAPLETCCECEGHPAPLLQRAARYRPRLEYPALTCHEPAPVSQPASMSLRQDPRRAAAELTLIEQSGTRWQIQQDLLGSAPDARHFVAEIDNEQRAQLRFGDGECGAEPAVGRGFTAHYRVGGGVRGNVGADAICRLVLKGLQLDGVAISVRNPLPAQGGIDPELLAEAKVLAPAAFRKQLLRAIIAEDYAQLAQRNLKLQRAAARLAWTGSWYEAEVAIDPLSGESAEPLISALSADLEQYRRMGHDLHVQPAVYVPVRLVLEVCVLPGFERGHVKAALLTRFGNRRDARGTPGFFHPDLLSFGEGVHVSRIIAAAQAVAGVQCAAVLELHRLFAAPNREISNGVLPLAGHEIAQLDNDPNHPQHGQLVINVRGGR